MACGAFLASFLPFGPCLSKVIACKTGEDERSPFQEPKSWLEVVAGDEDALGRQVRAPCGGLFDSVGDEGDMSA